ncbi:MAG: SDR family oxidoreductase [Ignavibacteriae bacterium]|nr:MAG: SDR family oxidoreductase [Ignavibacteriota bacterium]
MTDFDINVVGAVRVIQAVLPRLEKSHNASITLFSTVAVQLGMPFHSKVAASKGTVEGLTPRIRVNCIAPSLTDTPMAAQLLNTEQKREASDQRHPMKRVGTTADLAAMAEYLLSDKASWITGQVFHVDGGMSALRT